MDIPERHLITESDKGRIISNCFYCHKTPFCRETDDGWVTYCGNPDCEFKEKFVAPTRDESLCKWDDYINYELENPGLKERIKYWEKVQELGKETLQTIANQRRERDLKHQKDVFEHLVKEYKCPACGNNSGKIRDCSCIPTPGWYVVCTSCGLRTPGFHTSEEALYWWKQFDDIFSRECPEASYWLLKEFKQRLEDLRTGNNGDYSLNYFHIRHSLIDYLVASNRNGLVFKFAPLFTKWESGKDNPYKVCRVSDGAEFSKEDSDFLIDGVLRILEENKNG